MLGNIERWSSQSRRFRLLNKPQWRSMIPNWTLKMLIPFQSSNCQTRLETPYSIKPVSAAVNACSIGNKFYPLFNWAEHMFNYNPKKSFNEVQIVMMISVCEKFCLLVSLALKFTLVLHRSTYALLLIVFVVVVKTCLFFCLQNCVLKTSNNLVILCNWILPKNI